MSKLLDENSAPATKSELDLFTVPLSQIGIVHGNVSEVRLQNANSSNGPWEFRMEANPQAIDLNKIYVYIAVKIVNNNGSAVTADGDMVGVINLLGKTFFKQIKVYINGKMVSDSSDKYAYRAYLETLLNMGLDNKNSFQTGAMYYADTPGLLNHVDNNGFKSRREWFKNGETVELMAPLHVDLFMQEKYLLPQTEMKIDLHRNSDQFCLLSMDPAKSYKIVVEDVKLYCRKVEPLPSLALALENTLKNASAKYPIRRVDMKSVRVNAGSHSVPGSVLFTGQLPRRLVFGLVDVEAFHGDYTKNPLNFEHVNVSEVSVLAGGHSYPATPLEMNFKSKRYIRAFINLFETMQMSSDNRGIEITYAAFANGYCFYAVDLTPDADDGSYWQPIKDGSISVNMKFAEAVPAPGYELICYAEYDNLLMIDQHRNVSYDYTL